MESNKKDRIALYEKLYAIMQDIPRIGKDRRNINAKYNYASEKAIKEVLHNALIKWRVLFKFEVLGVEMLDMQPGRSGDVRVTQIKTQYTFIDIDTGETEAGVFIGSGNGRDDKGIYAAITGSIKYILTSMFLIPTGDDPEDDRYEIKPHEETVQQVKPNASKPTSVPQKTSPEVPSAESKAADNREGDNADAKPKADITAEIKLTTKQQDVIIDAFEKVGIEVWDLEKVIGDRRIWTMAIRRKALEGYNGLTDKKKAFTREDFLAGKSVA